MAVLFEDYFGGDALDLSKWRFEMMKDGLHRTGNSGIDRDGDPSPDSVQGKRWDLWYDKYHKELAQIQDEGLALRMREDFEHDPTRQGTFMADRRLYGVWIDTWTRKWTPEGTIPISLFQFKEGSVLTVEVNFENQVVPGARSSGWMMAAEVSPGRYVEVDLFEYDPASPDSLMCKVVAEGYPDTPGGHVHFPGIGKGWHTLQLIWEKGRLAWKIDGQVVVQDTDPKRVPTEELYLIFSREGNSGVKAASDLREGDVLENPPYLPASPGLFAKNIFDNSHKLKDDYVLIKSVVVETFEQSEVVDENNTSVTGDDLKKVIDDFRRSVDKHLDNIILLYKKQTEPAIELYPVDTPPKEPMTLDKVVESGPGTIFDIVRSENSLLFNNGYHGDIEISSKVSIGLLWAGVNGERAPGHKGGGRGLRVDIGEVKWTHSEGLRNYYEYTSPDKEGVHSPTFTWGNTKDPRLCSKKITFTCVKKKIPELVEQPAPTTVADAMNQVNGLDVLVTKYTGYGTDSKFGFGGKQILVTNLLDRGKGSLREALSTKGARMIVFLPTLFGIITAATPYDPADGHFSVMGATAGGPVGIQNSVKNHLAVLKQRRTDCLWDNFGFYGQSPYRKAGEAVKRVDVQAKDVLSLQQGAKRNCFNQCTFLWGADETIQIYDANNEDTITDITIQYSLIGEALSNAGHPSGEHSKGALVGNRIKRISFHHNVFTLNMKRNARIYADLAQYSNNIIIANGDEFRGICIAASYKVQHFDIESNLVLGKVGHNPGGLVYKNGNKGGTMKLYSKGNIGGHRTSHEQDELDFWTDYGKPAKVELADKPHCKPKIVTHPNVLDKSFKKHVFDRVGCMPHKRRPCDLRVLNIKPVVTPLVDAPPEGDLAAVA